SAFNVAVVGQRPFTGCGHLLSSAICRMRLSETPTRASSCIPVIVLASGAVGAGVVLGFMFRVWGLQDSFHRWKNKHLTVWLAGSRKTPLSFPAVCPTGKVSERVRRRRWSRCGQRLPPE